MLPFHYVIFFHNHCTIDSTTMSIAYPQHIHTDCLQLHYPVDWLCCLHMLFFSQCDIFSQLLHNWHYTNVYSISATYTYSTVYNYSPMYTGFAVYICFLFTMWYFSTMTAQLTLHQCLQHILNIYIRYLFTIILPSILTLLFTYAVLFTMWYFFTITVQFTLQQCL